jgi:polar amino acid transport system substrate-binding protein
LTNAHVVIAILALLSAKASADPPPLKWGTDPTGGAPFVYRSKTDPSGPYIGFEVEIAAYIAAKLGRTSEMVAGDWAQLPQQLKKPATVENGVDVIFNGYELRRDLCEDFAPSRPYYAFRLSLLARRDSPVKSWGDLDGKSCAVLGGTVAHEYVLTRFGDRVRLPTNSDVANVIDLVDKGQFDTTVQDYPAAVHFLKEYPNLHQVDAPMRAGLGFYVIYYRKSDVELGRQIDSAIAAGLADGTFERIYRKYEIWTDDQRELSPWQTVTPYPPEFEAAAANPWPVLLRELIRAAGMTVLLAVVSFPLAMMIGLSVGVGRVYGRWWLRIPLTIYVEVIRGTPLILQLFMIYYVVPDLFRAAGLADLVHWLSPFWAGIIGLAINYSAYEAENYRAGLQAIPRGQIEAALSLGFTRWMAIRRVVVPQAVRIVIPPVTNDFIALFKDTAACSIIFVTELTRKYNELYNFNRSLIIELAFLTAALYLLMSYPLSLVAQWLERRLTPPADGGRP